MPRLVDHLVRETTPVPLALLARTDGAVALVRHAFAASSGVMGQAQQLRVALAVGGGGRLQQHSDTGELDAYWRAGQFNLVLPASGGRYASPAVEVLGLAVEWPVVAGEATLAALAPLANGLHRDPVVSTLLQALWAAGEAGILSDDYLTSAARTLVRRLAQLASQQRAGPSARRAAPLSALQLLRLEQFIEARPGQRLPVLQMADVLRMDATRFGRALRAATGLSPYAFLTRQRIQRASQQLLAGSNVTEVAHAAGYSNPSKFAAAFRRSTGSSPSAWVKQALLR